ncbi:MAG: D-alanine--D-alanine ligase [Xanthomonadales bacterium]|nr:D-alanine--D-alanine ligase [Xanthomonadales bacterium]NIX12542.1 D-alanine--D-alanine ligase [Xanthomonadales bacterium]
MSRLSPRHVEDPREFGRVGLLVGGESAERQVSLNGGNAVSRSLSRSEIRFEVYDGAGALFEGILAGRVDRVFNLMHGPGGEDGAVQGALELLKVPVTGSGVLGSALSMDKVCSKQIWREQGIPTTPFVLIGPERDDFGAIVERFGLPVFVKPTGLGSSIGVSKVTSPDGMRDAVTLARRYGEQVIVEPAVTGGEYFAGVLGRTTLPLIRIETPREFYDYEAKYHSDLTRYFCPSGLDGELEQRLQDLSLKAFDALGASGWGRVDFILDADGNPWFLEINTVPGMTDHSLVPQAAAEIGIGFDELVWRILETSL